MTKNICTKDNRTTYMSISAAGKHVKFWVSWSKTTKTVSLVVFIAVTLAVTFTLPTWLAPGQYAEFMEDEKYRARKAEAKERGHVALAVSVVLSMAVGLGIARWQIGEAAFKENLGSLVMAFLCLGLLFGAYVPQLVTNTYVKSRATDNIMATYLLLLIVGMCLKLTTYRKTYEDFIKKTKDERDQYAFFMFLFIIFSTCIPVVLTNAWQWQCYMYDSEDASEQLKLNRWLAPLCTFLTIFMCLHVYIPAKQSVLAIFKTQKTPSSR